MSIYLGEQPIAGIVDTSGKANISLDNLSPEGEAKFANKQLSNLVSEGHAKLQYAPFSVNNGRVTSTGDNGTLHLPETQYMKYNVTEVGTLTKNQGVISGFSTSNYAQTPSMPDLAGADSWEIAFPISISQLNSTQMTLFENGKISGSPKTPHCGVSASIQTSGVVQVYFGFNSSYQDIISVNSLSLDTNYIIKVKFTGSQYELYINDTLEGTYVSSTKVTYSSSYMHNFVIGRTEQAPSTYSATWPLVYGSIDLEQSYIKINGEYFWQGVVEGTENDYDYIKHSQVYIDVPFEQPTLTANGTLGGDSFAVESDTNASNCEAYKGFDNDSATYYCSQGAVPQWVTFYNPEPLKVSKLTITNINNANPKIKAGTIYASNDNSTWTELCTFTNSNSSQGAQWDIEVDSPDYYNYYKLYVTQVYTSGGAYMVFIQCDITAIYKALVSSSSILTCDPCIITTCDGRTKVFNNSAVYTISSTPVIVEKDWTQPTLTANGTIGGDSCACRVKAPGNSAYLGFGDNTSGLSQQTSATSGSTTQWVEFYTPEPIKATKISYTLQYQGTLTGNDTITVSASNDGIDYVTLASGISSGKYTKANVGKVINLNISSNTNFYKYYRLTNTTTMQRPASGVNYRSWFFGNIQITATYQETQADADGTYKVFKNINTGNLSLYDNFKISKTIPLNVNIYGNPTIDNGVVSNFSTSNYVTLPNTFSPGSDSWEYVAKVHFTQSGTSQGIFGLGDSNTNKGMVLRITGNESKFRLYLSSNGTSWDIANGVIGTYVCTVNTYYWVKLQFTGTQYIVSYSTDGITYTNDITVSSSTSIVQNKTMVLGVEGTTGNGPWLGSIDLKECYININDARWWSSVQSVYLLTDTTPAKLYIEGQRNDNLVYMGDVTINTGAITDITNVDFNMLRAELLKQPLSGIGMPSNKYIDLTLGATGSTYVAPANGWFVFTGQANATTNALGLVNANTLVQAEYGNMPNNNKLAAYVPARKGEIVSYFFIGINTSHANTKAYFVPAEGELHV